MTLAKFMDQFSGSSPVAPEAEVAITSLDQLGTSTPGSLSKFIEKFNGLTEPYYFYYVDGQPTVELRFEPQGHVYYLVGELGQLIPQDGVTTVCHIIDKSEALVPWSAKMVVQKLLRTVPTVEKEVEGTAVLHTNDKDKQCCGCGWRTDPRSIQHWESQWAAHKHEGEKPSVALVQYVEGMTLEEFTRIALEAKSAPRDQVEEASDIGHMAHTWLENYIKAILAKDQVTQNALLTQMCKEERASNCCYAALGWMKAHNVRWIETERKIYSKKYKYAGTMDGLALVDSCDDPACCRVAFHDRLSVIDWKSSNYLYIEYLFQTASYEHAYEEEFEIEVQDRWILRLGKEDGEFDPRHLEAEDFQEDFEGFLDALSLTRSVRLVQERMKGQKQRIKAVKKEAKAKAKEVAKAAEKEAKAKAREEKKAAKAAEKQRIKDAKKAAKAGVVTGNMEAHLTHRHTVTLAVPEVTVMPEEKVVQRFVFELPVERL